MPDLPLRDIHLPDSISWWPLALGWWLIIAAIVLCIILLYTAVRKWLKPTLRKEALLALDVIEKKYMDTEDASHCMAEMSMLLRRVVVSQNDSKKLPGITGMAWLEFLDKQIAGKEFSQGIGQSLLSGPYQRKVEEVNVSELIQLCKKWVKSL